MEASLSCSPHGLVGRKRKKGSGTYQRSEDMLTVMFGECLGGSESDYRQSSRATEMYRGQLTFDVVTIEMRRFQLRGCCLD